MSTLKHKHHYITNDLTKYVNIKSEHIENDFCKYLNIKKNTIVKGMKFLNMKTLYLNHYDK